MILNDYIFQVIDIALKAGKEVMSIYESPNSDFEIEIKVDNSPLTVADKKSNEIITNFLKTTDFPILSEEANLSSYEVRKQWKIFWIVDPLDGTKEFIKRNGEFTINIALAKDGIPIMGVIYVPVKQTLYWGIKGEGAYKIENIKDVENITYQNLKRKALVLPGARHADSYVVVASRSHLSTETQRYIDEIKKIHPNLEIDSVGSSIKICWVAEGKADIYPRFAPTMEWDTAAGHAIAIAAGADIYHADSNNPITYNKEDLHNPWFIVKRN